MIKSTVEKIVILISLVVSIMGANSLATYAMIFFISLYISGPFTTYLIVVFFAFILNFFTVKLHYSLKKKTINGEGKQLLSYHHNVAKSITNSDVVIFVIISILAWFPAVLYDKYRYEKKGVVMNRSHYLKKLLFATAINNLLFSYVIHYVTSFF